jgi:hypothetical protein
MRHLLLILLAIASLSATDWTPQSTIPINSDTTILAVGAVRTISIFRQFSDFRIPATVATVQASATPIKSTRQVWGHGVVYYFHGVPIASKTGTLNPGENAIVDGLYNADPDYIPMFTARLGADQPIFWISEFVNTYKARWDATYNPAYSFGTGQPTSPAIIFTLRIESFAGVDPLPIPIEHINGSLVPITAG